MSFVQWVMGLLGLVREEAPAEDQPPDPANERADRRTYPFTMDLAGTIRYMAEQEHRSEEDVSKDVARQVMAHYQAVTDLHVRWETLSKREQQTARLVQFGYTTAEIADEMRITENTVKAHVANALRKFDIHTRTELRALVDVLFPPQGQNMGK